MYHIPYRKMAVATAFVLCTSLSSIGQTTPPPPPPPPAPAQPPKPPAKIESFEEAQQALQKAQADLERSLKELKIVIPAVPDKAELEKMISEIKLAAEAQVTARGLSESHRAEIQKEMAASLKNAQEALKSLKDNKQLQEQMKEVQQKVQQELKQARVSMEAAAEEMRQFDAFVNSLAADGLLQKEAYRVEEKDGKLLIDGKEQPAAVYEKHQAFLKKHKGLTITKDEDGLQIRKQ